MLRFITAGSVDDGKSTLIGRLLLRHARVLRRPARALVATRLKRRGGAASTCRCSPTASRPSASRASPSTSRTAISPPRAASSSSPTRRATSSTRATWRRRASTADAVVLLVDATRLAEAPDGTVTLLPQTRRHTALVQLLGMRHTVVAVNKMDRDRLSHGGAYRRIVSAYRAPGGLASAWTRSTPLPVSGPAWRQRRPDPARSTGTRADPDRMARGRRRPRRRAVTAPLRLAVQSSTVRSGRRERSRRAATPAESARPVNRGQDRADPPRGAEARVAAIETFDGALASAGAGRSIAYGSTANSTCRAATGWPKPADACLSSRG